LPDARKTAAIWRDYCRAVGIGEIHLCAALTHGNLDHTQFEFDSGVEFPPHNLQCRNLARQIAFREPFRGYVVDYQEIAQAYLDRTYRHPNVFRGVFPAWDNTPRTGNRGVIVLNTSPENYECWLAQAISRTMQDFPGQDRLVFINAWNEWAEGCHLEPDRKYQRRYLEATRNARNDPARVRRFAEVPDPILADEMQRRLLPDLRAVLTYHAYLSMGRLSGWLKGYPRLRRFIRWVLNGGR
jgi:lipopolysaccharide biosynthesis protein